ncbi:hypothetical protein ISCGN_003662 [Ixodes scapularis]
MMDPSTEEDLKRPDQDTPISADNTVGQLVEGEHAQRGGRLNITGPTPIYLAHQCPGADGSLPGIQALTKKVPQGSILLELDQTAAVAAINRRGRPCSPELARTAHEIWSWCWARRISFRALHNPGRTNTGADQASRRFRYGRNA